MNTEELKKHVLRRLYELAEAKGYQHFFSLDEIAAEVGVVDRMKVLRLGQDLKADSLITLAATSGGTEASINMRGARIVEEAFASDGQKTPVRQAESGLPVEMSDKLQIFISHSSRDELVAGRLVSLLRASLNLRPAEIRCTSVDGHRLEVGADTGSQLRRELIEARFFIGIISSFSMTSAWVLFELGARWGAEKPLAPVLAPGATTDLLRGPLVTLSALSCSSSAQLHQLIDNIGRHLGISPNPPNSYQYQLDELVGIGPQARKTTPESSEVSTPSSLSESDLMLLFRRRLLMRLREEGELTLDLRQELEGSSLPMSSLKAEIGRLAEEARIEIVYEGSNLVVVHEPPLYLEPRLLD